jgi:hypothetical protein
MTTEECSCTEFKTLLSCKKVPECVVYYELADGGDKVIIDTPYDYDYGHQTIIQLHLYFCTRCHSYFIKQEDN